MKPILLHIFTALFVLLFISQIKAQTLDPEIILDDVSSTIVKGSCSITGPGYVYTYVFSAPAKIPRKIISPYPLFYFTTLGAEEYSISVSVSKIEGGRIIATGYKELIITVVTIYEDILNAIDCSKIEENTVISTLPFISEYTTPDYDLCSLCNYLNALTVVENEAYPEFDYVVINMDLINQVCHHDENEYAMNPLAYDFCNESFFSEFKDVEGKRLARNNTDQLINGATIQLYNLQGALVYNSYYSNEFKLNNLDFVKELYSSQGIYIIRIIKDNQELLHHRIVN